MESTGVYRKPIYPLSHQVCYQGLGDAYLEKCNRYRLTGNLVRPFERLGSSVTLQQKAA